MTGRNRIAEQRGKQLSVNVRPGETTEQLSPKQDMLIALLLAGVSTVAAAAQVGIAEKTAHKWLKQPHFQAAYKSAQASLFDDRLSVLRDGVDVALATIKRTMTSDDAQASVQLRAAQIWLEQAISLHKMSELEAKYSELEALVKGMGK